MTKHIENAFTSTDIYSFKQLKLNTLIYKQLLFYMLLNSILKVLL